MLSLPGHMLRYREIEESYHNIEVRDLINRDLLKWDLFTILHLLSIEKFEAINMIPIHLIDRDDLVVWLSSKSGVYDVKTSYQFIRNNASSSNLFVASSSFSVNKRIWKTIWHLDCKPK